MLSIQFDSGFSFEIESISETYNGDNGSYDLMLRCSLMGEKSAEIQKSITPQNMKHFIVLSDDEQVDEFVGYSHIVSVDKIITKHERSLCVRARKEG